MPLCSPWEPILWLGNSGAAVQITSWTPGFLSFLLACPQRAEFSSNDNEAGSVLGEQILSKNSIYIQMKIVLVQIQSNIKFYISLLAVVN